MPIDKFKDLKAVNIRAREGPGASSVNLPSSEVHTSLDKHVIDANVGGNAARWINHACDTNCEADEVDGRIFIKATREVQPGEELFYDYGLVIDDRLTAKLKREYPCHCGSARCRGTLLAPKRR